MTEIARQYQSIRELLGAATILEFVEKVQSQTNGSSPPLPSLALPRWDSRARTLSFRGMVLKRYVRNRADNQMAVLDAFEEEGWPASIEAPVRANQIRETIRSLNIAIGRNAPIRFFLGRQT